MELLSRTQRQDTCLEALESTRPSRPEIPGHTGHHRCNACPSRAMQPRKGGKLPDMDQAARIPRSDRTLIAPYTSLRRRTEQSLRYAGGLAIYEDPADLLAQYDHSPLAGDGPAQPDLPKRSSARR